MVNENKFLDQLRNHGYRVTPQRQEIIRVLSRKKGHQSAEEIHKEVCLNYPGMSLDTVYRNLGLLKSLNIVNKINFNGKNHYELNTGDGHYHHLICLKCGESQKLDFCPLEFLDWKKILKNSFKVKKHRFEIFGYCSACMDKEENQGREEND